MGEPIRYLASKANHTKVAIEGHDYGLPLREVKRLRKKGLRARCFTLANASVTTNACNPKLHYGSALAAIELCAIILGNDTKAMVAGMMIA